MAREDFRTLVPYPRPSWAYGFTALGQEVPRDRCAAGIMNERMLAKSKKVTFVEQVSREQSEYFRKQINFSTGNICPSAMSIMVSTAAARSSLRLWRQPAAGKFWQAGAYFSTSCDQERSMAVPRQEPSPRCWLIEAAEQA